MYVSLFKLMDQRVRLESLTYKQLEESKWRGCCFCWSLGWSRER